MIKLVFLFLFTAGISAHGQSIPRKNIVFDYSKGYDAGIRVLPILSGDLRQAFVTLSTSWVPGPDHKGMFRYKVKITSFQPSLSVQAKTPEPSYGWDFSTLIDKFHSCDYTLRVFDKGEFILRRIPLAFLTDVDDAGKSSAISANDMSSMDLDEYRSFLSANKNISWDVTWICPK